MSVILDIIDGSRARLTTTGWELTRIAHVTGLTSSGEEMLIAAAAVSGMPLIGSSHPAVWFLILEEIIPEMVGAGEAKVRLIYRSSEGSSPTGQNNVGGATIENGASTQQKETYEDASGNLLVVPYTDHDSQVKPVSVNRPQHTKTFSWVSYDDADYMAETFLGKVNSGTWRQDPGCAPRTWLCTEMSSRSRNGGKTYTITASFEKNTSPPAGNWDSTLVWIDPETGRPPSDVAEGNGQETFQMYQMVNFNAFPCR